MRTHIALVTIIMVLSLGCSGPGADDTAADATMPQDAAHSGVMPGDSVHGGGMEPQLNTELAVDEGILNAWSGIRVRLENTETGEGQSFDVPLEETVSLGDSGLSLTAKLFIPAFVMDENGITSSSAEPENPAARVVIREEGQEDYEGWLFAAVPEIHPYPHEHYRVLLVEGIPAE